MADFVKGFFGGAKPSASPAPVADADFADFAAAPSPTPVSVVSDTYSVPRTQETFGPGVPFAERPYTKWYRVHERVSRADFVIESFIIPLLLVLIAVHVWGTRANRRKAKAWVAAHAPALISEFAVVGFGSSKPPVAEDAVSQGLAKATSAAGMDIPSDIFKEKSKDVFVSYATGRQNIAFVDVKLSLYKRYNPLALVSDVAMGFFFDTLPPPTEKAELTAYAFDGKEGELIPRPAGQPAEKRGRDSVYDGFVWAIVHKDKMKALRDERYDLSLTITKDNAKLPVWATIMSESAEITDTLLTADLVKAVEACGDSFESLIVTDMPQDAPKTLDDLVPRKRLSLSVGLDSSTTPVSVPIVSAFLRLPDHLVSSAHFRNEVMRRVRATREEEAKKIRKLDELEKAEGRKNMSDKAKKEERDRKLKGMTADEQKKFLDKEREKDQRKMMSKKSVKA